jgi:hypothetical protein
LRLTCPTGGTTALQPAFVPLIGETVAWLAAADRAPEALVAGMTPAC